MQKTQIKAADEECIIMSISEKRTRTRLGTELVRSCYGLCELFKKEAKKGVINCLYIKTAVFEIILSILADDG